MAIKRENKFDKIIENLNTQEPEEQEKSKQVVKDLTGGAGQTRVIVDKNGRTRAVRTAEKRKTFPVYVPESLYERFNRLTTEKGISNNAAICKLIREYVERE